MRREILAAYGIPFPEIPGKTVRFFYEDGSSRVMAEVFAQGALEPEWSAERDRLEKAVRAVCEQYSIAVPVVPGRRAEEDAW